VSRPPLNGDTAHISQTPILPVLSVGWSLAIDDSVVRTQSLALVNEAIMRKTAGVDCDFVVGTVRPDHSASKGSEVYFEIVSIIGTTMYVRHMQIPPFR
jgi:hypothetical protein